MEQFGRETIDTNQRVRKVIAADDDRSVFYYLAFYVQDPYWQQFFAQVYMHGLPRFFSHKGGKLIYKQGKKTASLDISISQLQLSAFKVVTFFQTHGGFYSPSEKATTNVDPELQPIELKSVRSKEMKRAYVLAFCKQMGEKYHLTPDQRNNLYHTILSGMFEKKITSAMITFADGEIKNIGGIIYNRETGRFELDSTLVPKITKKNAKKVEEQEVEFFNKQGPNFGKAWKKLLKKTAT